MNARELRATLRGPDRVVETRSAARAAELAAAAADRRLLDVAIGEVDSPIGRLLVGVTRRGLVRVAFVDDGHDTVLRELAARLSPRVLESAAATEDVRRELDEYFAGERTRFEVRIDWSLVRGSAKPTLRAISRVPFGRRTTYRELAVRVGNPKAARAIGSALGSNPVPIVVPCHRVLRSDGSLGGYAGGVQRKEVLLGLEGALL